ncbi:hypothetical protein AJ79_03014 [Helicocarpus griseus UAMH5409]|uniref:SMP-30/Gluconolactonase/LRE-like region domain-containing protein n=1 Tax=Helicocarpus griseus UAMH5409 TaxID=1447875 RepID=A0A2B7Y0G7_9EURO|nr:hypothetical protein AJ79_03014 [Helicocarpus griseus UAMH5409]
MTKHGSHNRLAKLAFAASLITTALATPLDPTGLLRRADSPKVDTQEATECKLDPKSFGASVEGVSVNKAGDVYAVDFHGNAEVKEGKTPDTIGFFHKVEGGVGGVMSQTPFIIPQGDAKKPPFLAGSRFVKGGANILVADAQNKRVMSVDVNTKQSTVFCQDPGMLQPNDISISTKKDCLIYLSGQNYTVSTAGKDGDIWTCDGNKATKFPADILKEANIHRTNGIEADPTGEFLYVTSVTNKEAGVVTDLKIFKFALDKATGHIREEKPTLFHHFQNEAKGTDLDGMRTDVDGNLYVALNAGGRIAKLNKEGNLVQYINTPALTGPSNLELGGKDGKTLFAVGKCKDASKGKGCAVMAPVDKPGRAFESLNGRK